MDANTAGFAGSIIVALIALYSARLSQKAAAKASTQDTQLAGRIKMEDEAYERARVLDVATIERQATELKEVHADYIELKAKYEDLEGKYDTLKDDYDAQKILNKRLTARLDRLEERGEPT